MLSFLSKLTPWRIIGAVAGLVVLIGIITLSVNWFQARNLDKARKQYEVDKASWATERAGMLSRAEEAEKRAAALEPKAIAFDALAAQHKAADPALVKQIEEVSKNEVDRLANAEQPTNCRDRVQSVCDLLRARNPKYDCGTIFRENCGQ